MKTKWAVKLILVISWLALTSGVASAEHTYAVSSASIDNLNGWVEMDGIYSQTVSGSNGFSNMDTNAYGDGLGANLKVKSAYCPSYCMVRLDRYIGYYNGNLLRVEFRLGKWEDNQTIEYRVRETDSSGHSIRDIIRGFFGSSTGQYWALNEDVLMAVALEGNEFIFYSNKYDQIAKLQLLGPITPFQNPLSWRVNIWTETANDSMAVDASGFLAVDVSDLVTVLPSYEIVGDWDLFVTTGENTCGASPGDIDEDDLVVEDTGVFITDGETFVGDIGGGDMLSWSGSYSFPDDDGMATVTDILLTVLPDGNSLEGIANWLWTNNEFSCSGVNTIMGVRVN